MHKQFRWDLLPAEIPEHGAQLVVLVEADPVIDGVKMMGILLEENVTTFAVGVVAEQVEKDNRFEKLPVCLAEAEVMIFGVVVDILLERPRAKRTVVAQRGKRHDVKAKVLADEIGGDFASCQRVLREIAEWLLAA